MKTGATGVPGIEFRPLIYRGSPLSGAALRVGRNSDTLSTHAAIELGAKLDNVTIAAGPFKTPAPVECAGVALAFKDQRSANDQAEAPTGYKVCGRRLCPGLIRPAFVPTGASVGLTVAACLVPRGLAKRLMSTTGVETATAPV